MTPHTLPWYDGPTPLLLPLVPTRMGPQNKQTGMNLRQEKSPNPQLARFQREDEKKKLRSEALDQKSASRTKPLISSPAAGVITPAFWYSPTRFSKKFVLPCNEISSIQSEAMDA